jgi:hypothetical protein
MVCNAVSSNDDLLCSLQAMIAFIAEALGRDPSTVFIQNYSLSRRRVLSLRNRNLANTLNADIGLLPNGQPNNAPESQVCCHSCSKLHLLLFSLLWGLIMQLSDSIGGTVPSSPLLSGPNVVPGSVGTQSVCGNGACEAGERPDAAQGVIGCPDDCPNAVLVCPSANGAVCNGAGLCIAGACECYSAQGYVGDDCSTCASGFSVAGPGLCRRLEASAYIPPLPSPGAGKSSSRLSPRDTGLIVGGAVLASLVVATAAFLLSRNAKKQKVYAAELTQTRKVLVRSYQEVANQEVVQFTVMPPEALVVQV